MARIGSDMIYDMDDLRAPMVVVLPDGKTATKYSATINFNRRMSGGATQMIAVLTWRLSIPCAESIRTLVNQFSASNWRAAIRETIISSAKHIQNAPSLNRERKEVFDYSSILFGDVDLFIEQASGDAMKPTDIVFAIKRPVVQSIWMKVNQSISWVELASMSDLCVNNIHYSKLYTFAQHLYSQDFKLFLFQTALKLQKSVFACDYFIHEFQLIEELPNLIDNQEPVLLRNFGRIHLYFRGQLFECDSLEHALFAWLMVIRHKLEGTIGEECIDWSENRAISTILGEKEAIDAASKRVVELVNQVTGINIDDF